MKADGQTSEPAQVWFKAACNMCVGIDVIPWESTSIDVEVVRVDAIAHVNANDGHVVDVKEFVMAWPEGVQP